MSSPSPAADEHEAARVAECDGDRVVAAERGDDVAVAGRLDRVGAVGADDRHRDLPRHIGGALAPDAQAGSPPGSPTRRGRAARRPLTDRTLGS